MSHVLLHHDFSQQREGKAKSAHTQRKLYIRLPNKRQKRRATIILFMLLLILFWQIAKVFQPFKWLILLRFAQLANKCRQKYRGGYGVIFLFANCRKLFHSTKPNIINKNCGKNKLPLKTETSNSNVKIIYFFDLFSIHKNFWKNFPFLAKRFSIPPLLQTPIIMRLKILAKRFLPQRKLKAIASIVSGWWLTMVTVSYDKNWLYFI